MNDAEVPQEGNATLGGGRKAVYAGDVAVAHVQHSSLAKAKSPAAMGQVFGNKIKLEAKYDDKVLDLMIGRNFEMACKYLLDKQASLP